MEDMIDPEDGWLDGGKFLLEYPYAVLPVPIIITEPAVGTGLGVAAVHFHDTREDTPVDELDSQGRTIPRSVSALALGATNNDTKFVGGGHFGFYNQGLTLAVLADPEEVPSRFGNILFKIKSRYLEHTLSRETVLKDENYEKAMHLLTAAADGPLHEKLVTALEAVASAETFSLAELTRYQQLMSFLLCCHMGIVIQDHFH